MNAKMKAVVFLSAAVLVLAANGCAIITRRAFPKTTGSVTLQGIQAPVEVRRDRYGVPHIYAQSAEDLLFAQGYVHAQDRFWQMEFQRRVAAGRLSELFGKKLLETDIFLRTLGFQHVAEQEYRLLDPEAKRFLDCYVAGVNAYIRGRKPGRISVEYALLKLRGTDFQVEEWKPTDSLTWAKMMAWDLDQNLDMERLLLEVVRTAGLEGARRFFAPYRPDMPTVLSGEEVGLEPSARLAEVALSLYAGRDSGVGSNSWVLSGERTESGKPILANDTHLHVQMPSIWYEVGLHTVDRNGNPVESRDALNVRGFSFPGHPLVVIGHNPRIAWGITDFPDDSQDLYTERINPLAPDQYWQDGAWREMEIIPERIDIQGQKEPFVHLVRRTSHGPVISDRGGYKALESFGYSGPVGPPEGVELTTVSLRWNALLPGKLLRALIDLDRAGSFQEFRKALSAWSCPVQNIIYADVEGNIGYQVAGLVPVRARGEGEMPVPGWTGEYQWTGFVPFDALPHVLNPAKGYIVSANNPAVGPGYPYFLGMASSYGYRARRIVEMIEAQRDGISVEEVRTMQADTYDQAAWEIVRRLEGLDLQAGQPPEILREKEPVGRKARKKREKLARQVEEALEPARRSLLDWDCRMEMDSSEAALYGYFFLSLLEETFRDQYPYQRWGKISEGRSQNALFYLLQDPANPWWDDVRTPELHEKRDDILARAFRKGLERGIEKLGADLHKWKWGKVHHTEFRNATLGESGIKLIENIFNRGPVATPGSSTTVTVARWDREKPFDVYHIPAMRQIIDLGDLDAALSMHVPGQSGHAGHRHYDDLIDPWRHVEYHPMIWSRDQVEANQKGKLVLKPAAAE